MKLHFKIDLQEFDNPSLTGEHYIEFINIENHIDWNDEVVQLTDCLSLYIDGSDRELSVFNSHGGGQTITSHFDEVSTNGRYIEFDGEFSTFSGDVIYFITENILQVSAVDGSVLVYLFTQNSENNELNKTLQLVNIIAGKFNSAFNLKNPILDIKYTTSGDVLCNYMYIPSLFRYYYVDSVDIISADYMRYKLKEDVLMSWQSLIRSQDALVTRYELSTDTKLSDVRLPIENVVSVTYTKPTNVSSGSLVNTTFSANPSGSNILVSTIASSDVAVTKTNVSSPLATGLPTINGTISNTEHVYFITKTDYDLLYYANFHDSESAGFVNTILWLPFATKDPFEYQLTTTYISPIHANDKYLFNDEIPSTRWVANDSGHTPDILAYESKLSGAPYIIVADFNFTSASGLSFAGNFLDYEPYSVWEIYIPFVSWQQIAYKDLKDSRILVYYTMDIHTGSATAFIYNVTKQKLLWSGSCQIGIQLPITNSNALEIQKQQQANQLNMIMSLIGSAVSVGAGVFKQNPVAIAGGVITGVKSIASAVNSEMMMIDRAITSFGSSESCVHSPLDVVVRHTYHEQILDSTALTKFKKINGLPYNRYTSLSSLTGYVEIGEIHFNPKNNLIAQDEITEIEQLLKIGVIF